MSGMDKFGSVVDIMPVSKLLNALRTKTQVLERFYCVSP
jgi:hypothetical protein